MLISYSNHKNKNKGMHNYMLKRQKLKQKYVINPKKAGEKTKKENVEQIKEIRKMINLNPNM